MVSIGTCVLRDSTPYGKGSGSIPNNVGGRNLPPRSANLPGMRTTLNIDDDLYREVKATAARRGCSVTSLVEESLRVALARHLDRGEVRPLRVSQQTGGTLPGVDLHDNSALVDLMDEGQPVDALR